MRVNVSKLPTKTQLCIGPACQYFTCAKKALKIIRGKVICALTNDACIGYKCQYALCSAHAMGPNGECTLNVEDKRIREVEEEAKALDKDFSKIKGHLKKLGLEDYI